MKITVWHPPFEIAEIKLADTERVSIQPDLIIGYIDLPIEKPKKTVVKEASLSFTHGYLNFHDKNIKDTYEVKIPINAKNIKCTYEVEE